MPSVLDLIEIGFKSELDPQGWKMLRQMRQVAKSGTLSRAVYGASRAAGGFVWVEQGDVVANLSLRRAQPHSQRGRMIGNVVVHPDWRGRGIGRALMVRGLRAAREEGARWVGLEVRADNEVACQLYEGLGFRSVGKVEHLLRPDGVRWPRRNRPSLTWRRSRPRDESQWRRLASAMHSPDQRRVLEIATQRYQFGGLERRLDLWLSRHSEQAFVCGDDAGIAVLAVHLKTDHRHHYHVWDLLAPSDIDRAVSEAIVDQCMYRAKRLPSWPTISMVPVASPLVTSLVAAGFNHHRVLQQMLLEL